MSIDLTLDRIHELTLYVPKYTRPTCHITGTNGKGSVASLLSSILVASSLSVGRFNSPHLVSVRDSITINNNPISAQVYNAARETVEEADRIHGCRASTFEILTLTALLVFEQATVDIAVVEVGMGGRLDATNVIPDSCIIVSALTTVDLDHTTFLGPTVSDIAVEKAGIARTGKPFVLGEQKYDEIDDVVKAVVTRIGADVVHAETVLSREWDACRDGRKPDGFSLSAGIFKPPPPQPVRIRLPCFSEPIDTLLPLYGDHQLANLAVATTIVSTIIARPLFHLRDRITPMSIALGVRSTAWPGRLTFHSIFRPSLSPQIYQGSHKLTVLADGAHNPSSSTTLALYISSLFNLISPDTKCKTASLTYILALSHSRSKSPIETLRPLFSLPFSPANLYVAVLGFSAMEGMPWVNPVPPRELETLVKELVDDANIWCDEEGAGIEKALTWASEMQAKGGDDGLVVIAGSLYLIADFYRFLEVSEKKDVERVGL